MICISLAPSFERKKNDSSEVNDIGAGYFRHWIMNMMPGKPWRGSGFFVCSFGSVRQADIQRVERDTTNATSTHRLIGTSFISNSRFKPRIHFSFAGCVSAISLSRQKKKIRMHSKGLGCKRDIGYVETHHFHLCCFHFSFS